MSSFVLKSPLPTCFIFRTIVDNGDTSSSEIYRITRIIPIINEIKINIMVPKSSTAITNNLLYGTTIQEDNPKLFLDIL